MIIIKIKVVGSNCKNGNQLYKNTQKAIISLKNKNIELLKDDVDTSLHKYNIKNKPGLIIEDKVICQGKVLTERELQKLINIASIA